MQNIYAALGSLPSRDCCGSASPRLPHSSLASAKSCGTALLLKGGLTLKAPLPKAVHAQLNSIERRQSSFAVEFLVSYS